MRTLLLVGLLGLATLAAGCLGGDADESTVTGDEGIGSSGVDGTGSGGVTNTTGQQSGAEANVTGSG